MASGNVKQFSDNPLTFGVNLTDSDDRLDCLWFNPEIENKIDKLKESDRCDRKLVKLNQIAEIKGGKRLPKGTVIVASELNTIPYINAKDVKNLKANWKTAIQIPHFVHQKIRNYQLQLNDIVVTIVGTIGEVGIVEDNVEVCNMGENVAKIRITNELILPRYITYFLDSEFGKIQTDRLSCGSLQHKLSLTNCKNLEVFIPFKDNNYDIDEQKRILLRLSKTLRQITYS